MKFFSISATRQLALLTPEHPRGPAGFGRADVSPSRRSRLLRRMQQMRGQVYLSDGAITSQDLTSDGRHIQAADYDSWHVLTIDGDDRVFGCARYTPYELPVDFRQLSVGRSEIAYSEVWSERLRRAVRREIERAGERNVAFAEVGGWALTEEVRSGTEALRIALAMFSLAQLLGGCIGLTTATVRHSSSTILRKIGGESLFAGDIEIPRYFDTRYGCEMEILRFDSSRPSDRYTDWVGRLSADLSGVDVVSGSGVRELPRVSGETYGRVDGPALPLVPQYT